MKSLIESLQWFVRVAESGSFSSVARENMTNQVTVSRRIKALETHFRISLFRRSTRSVSLTREGQAFLVHARRMLEEIEEIERTADRARSQASGHIRVGTTNALGLHLSGQMAEFHRKFPGIEVDLILSDMFTNVIEEGFDVAVRTREVREASLVSNRLGDIPRYMVASPKYIAERGRPEDLAALKKHECVLFSYGATDPHWKIGDHVVRVSGSFRTNSSIAQLEAVQNGMGISVFPRFQVDEAIRKGRLVRILPQVVIDPIHPFLTYPAHQTVPPRTRIVIKWITDELGKFSG